MAKAVRFIEAESRVVVARGWGRENGGFCSTGTVSVMKTEKVLQMCCATILCSKYIVLTVNNTVTYT